jgi:CRP-like cAMP-binding protein
LPEKATIRGVSPSDLADARRSRLLSSLPEEEQRRLAPFLHLVPVRSREALAKRGERIENVYFPIDAVTSTLIELPEGECIEVGLMGAEGVTGLSLLYGEQISNSTVIGQIPGDAVRIAAADFERQVVAHGGAALALLLRYANAFMGVVGQVAACNASHDVQQRFARWLLLVHDRVGRNEFPVTHEFASLMLGVRRASVTHAANDLRLSGAIEYEAGRVCVKDRAQLLKAACGCYAAMNETLASVFDDASSLPRRDGAAADAR